MPVLPNQTQLWAQEFLRALGNNNPSANTIAFVQGWGIAEGGWINNTCTFNLLNTKAHAPGSYNCTPGGVQAYTSLAQGAQTNAGVLTGGDTNYAALLNALRSNDENALGFNGHTMSSGVMKSLIYWKNGNATAPDDQQYLNNIAQNANAHAGLLGVFNLTPSAAASSATGTGTPGNCAPWDIGCLMQQLSPTFTSYGEHIAIFILALLMIGAGLYLLAGPEIAQGVKSVASASAKVAA